MSQTTVNEQTIWEGQSQTLTGAATGARRLARVWVEDRGAGQDDVGCG
jgi:hypothetical protein